MRLPFSKKSRELIIPAVDEQSWSVVQGGYDGSPLLLRFNKCATALAGHPDLPIKLGFAIPLNRPQEGGLPDPEEDQELEVVENLISERVLDSGVGLHAMTLTSGVMKEYVFYVAPRLDIAGPHEGLREAVPSHDLHCMATNEPSWMSFRELVP